jgi:hypothetical protein
LATRGRTKSHTQRTIVFISARVCTLVCERPCECEATPLWECMLTIHIECSWCVCLQESTHSHTRMMGGERIRKYSRFSIGVRHHEGARHQSTTTALYRPQLSPGRGGGGRERRAGQGGRERIREERGREHVSLWWLERVQ